ncbi:MAG: ABC transporter permease, partial [Roseomonas sp.]|nr:ABC transporter permease [Roseomonas sp.]
MKPGAPPLLLAGLALPGAACLLLFFLLPLGVIAAEAFVGGGSGFVRLLQKGEFWTGLRNTFLLGVTAGLVSLVVGFAVALHLSRLSETRRMSLLLMIS